MQNFVFEKNQLSFNITRLHTHYSTYIFYSSDTNNYGRSLIIEMKESIIEESNRINRFIKNTKMKKESLQNTMTV